MKNNQNYTTSFTVDQTPKEVFDAINNVRGWWSEEIEGRTDRPDAEWIYRYKDVHQCKMKITEFIPGQKVVWLVVDNHFNFTKDKTEWKGTKVIFEISRKGNKTEVRFTHQGLVPQYECFDVCSDAWGSYIKGSLRNLITKGKGQPNPLEKVVAKDPGNEQSGLYNFFYGKPNAKRGLRRHQQCSWLVVGRSRRQH